MTIYHFPFLWFCSSQLFVPIKNIYFSLKKGRGITIQFWSSSLLFIWQWIYSVLRRDWTHKCTYSWYFFPDAEGTQQWRNSKTRTAGIPLWNKLKTQCSVSLHFIFISILSFEPGWIKLSFHLPCPLVLVENGMCVYSTSNLPSSVKELLLSPFKQNILILLCYVKKLLNWWASWFEKVLPVLGSWSTILALLKFLLTLERQRLYFLCNLSLFNLQM